MCFNIFVTYPLVMKQLWMVYVYKLCQILIMINIFYKLLNLVPHLVEKTNQEKAFKYNIKYENIHN